MVSIQGKNVFIADKLRLLGNLLTLDGASVWKVRAYNNAAEVLSGLDVPATSISDFEKYEGIGSSTASVIEDIIKTGTTSQLESLKKKYPNAEDAFKLTCVSGVGVKKAIGLYNQGITNLEQLAAACEAGKISNSNIVRGVQLALKSRGRLPLNEVLPIILPLLWRLRQSEGVIRAEFAGSVRRGKETIKDVDVIVCSTDRAKTVALFKTFGDLLVEGDEKVRVMVPVDSQTSVQFDLLLTEEDSFGAALCYFTGSKEHNVSLRSLAKSKGYTINEHGFYTIGGKKVGGREEKELYDLLGLPWVPPELREGSEILTKVPDLVDRGDIWGDFHVHSRWSADAKDSIMDMAIAAKNRGLKCLGITDHVEAQYGWDPALVDQRIEEIKEAERETGIKIIPAAEVGVTSEGELIDRIPFDKQEYLIASIHIAHHKNPVERLISAIQNPKVKIIGHPTGLMMGKRDIPDGDWDRLFVEAAKLGVLLEINGARMDLPVDLIKRAKNAGCKFIINSDAHSVDGFFWQDIALTLARRAGLEKKDLAIPWSKNEGISGN
jgi:DNA polymerase (family X)